MDIITNALNIINDGDIQIAIGKSRKETSWKSIQLLWSDFVNKVKNTHRTAETYNEFLASKKDRQDEIKDVGGFVGGTLTGGRRKEENVTNRQIITLDVDFAKNLDIWAKFKEIYGKAALIYTTHKHSKNAPRFRLVVPLKTPIFRDQYEPIARKIAFDLDINSFDDTTYQVARLMYWPSTSKDGEYYFDYIDSEWMDPKDILNSYIDWRDSSQWAQSDRVSEIVKREIKKQDDPIAKPGIVGAFCRTYTIQETIEEFLFEEYEACGNGRYSYKGGSTAAGLVVYDDKFAYSHHGTDPISNKLCNAFDLVRLHKFGLKDENSKENTPINKLPSYIAMEKFCIDNKKVKKSLTENKVKEAEYDFVTIDVNALVKSANMIEDKSWCEKLAYNTKGKILSTIDNVVTILENDVNLKNCLAYDDFGHKELVLKTLPWRAVDKYKKHMLESDDSSLRHYLEVVYGVSGEKKISDALTVVVSRNTIHPVKDYLNSLFWDGVSRIDTLFIEYLGVKDSEYARAVTRKSLVAAVKRIFEPGCKYDYVLTLVGKTGAGKSTLLKKLGKTWFSDSLTSVIGKDAYEQLQGVWLIELGELSALKKAEVNQIKHFITKQEDIFRVAYGRRTENFPRQCVFFGTTNDMNFLSDPTGNRRFWPLDIYEHSPIKSIDDLDEFETNQMWAEAMDFYAKGETVYLPKELEKEANNFQTEHKEINEKEGLILDFLDMDLPICWDDMDLHDRRAYLHNRDAREERLRTSTETFKRDKVCVAEIWCELFSGEQKDLGRWLTKEIYDILRNIDDWEEKTDGDSGKLRFKLYGKQKAYIKPNCINVP